VDASVSTAEPTDPGHPAKKNLYIALADRWVTDLPERIGAGFATGGSYAAVAHAIAAESDPDGSHGVRGSDQLPREADAVPLRRQRSGTSPSP
jgi:hypothetical protein